jgi:hypothetical protein
VTITTVEARQKIIDDLAVAVEGLEFAVACLGEAYEQLDTGTADRLESELFRPLQRAFGRAKRTQVQFASRHGLEPRALPPAATGRSSQGVKSFVERATTAAGAADRTIAELQDSMLPIEAGDAELRGGLADVRDLLASFPLASRQFLSTLGR